jgi:putative transposase
MKRKRFTEEQIIGVLKEHELGAKTADLCRKHGISEATFYNWKSKFGGMDVSEARRLKQLVDENGKLKKLLADAMLDNAALKDLLSSMHSSFSFSNIFILTVMGARKFPPCAVRVGVVGEIGDGTRWLVTRTAELGHTQIMAEEARALTTNEFASLLVVGNSLVSDPAPAIPAEHSATLIGLHGGAAWQAAPDDAGQNSHCSRDLN